MTTHARAPCAQTGRVPVAHLDPGWSPSESCCFGLSGSRPRVHHGFQASYEASGIKSKILLLVLSLLASDEVDRAAVTVYVCGHSLGGALASLCAGAHPPPCMWTACCVGWASARRMQDCVQWTSRAAATSRARKSSATPLAAPALATTPIETLHTRRCQTCGTSSTTRTLLQRRAAPPACASALCVLLSPPPLRSAADRLRSNRRSPRPSSRAMSLPLVCDARGVLRVRCEVCWIGVIGS